MDLLIFTFEILHGTILRSKKHRDTFLGDRIDEDQAMPFMLPGGKQKFVDMKTYLYDVPFTCSANENY